MNIVRGNKYSMSKHKEDRQITQYFDEQEGPRTPAAIILRYDLRTLTAEQRKQLILDGSMSREEMLRPTHRVEISAGEGVVFDSGGKTKGVPWSALSEKIWREEHNCHEFVAGFDEAGNLLMSCVVPGDTHSTHHRMVPVSDLGGRVRVHVEEHKNGGDVLFVGFTGRDMNHARRVFEEKRSVPQDDLARMKASKNN